MVLIFLLAFFALGHLQMGHNKVHIQLGREKATDIGYLFDGFKKGYFVRVKGMAWVTLYSMLWLIPYMGVIVASQLTLVAEMEVLAIVFGILGFASFALAMVKILGYSLTTYLLIDEKYSFNTGLEAVTESVRLMHGNKMRLFLLGLSFFFWMLLVMVTFGLAGLYVIPYMSQATANFYLEITE